MKKIFLLVAFALVTSVASAWHTNSNAAVVVLATKYLTPEAKSVVVKHLGTAYEDDCGYIYALERKLKRVGFTELHYLHLDKNFQPMDVDCDDALVALEKELALLAEHEKLSDDEVKRALRFVINLMCDIHNLSNIRIENIPHSHKDFSFRRQKSEYTTNDYITYKWSNYWIRHSNSYAVFHADLMAEEMELSNGKRYEEFTTGNLRDWVADNGAKAAGFLEKMSPDSVISLREYLLHDYANFDMMTRAGFRLAVLLNNYIK